MNYLKFNRDLYCGEELHFKAGVRYIILSEIEGKYAVSYGRKNPMECSLIPKDFDGIQEVTND